MKDNKTRFNVKLFGIAMTSADASLKQLVIDVSQLLLANELQLCTAESCTGGWLAKCCTDFAGSSAWFERGFVTYSNESKQDLLDVQSATLTNYGAVSIQTASEMAQGALNHSNAKISVSITGIAGPDGGSKDKPVGTVCFAWASSSRAIITASHCFQGDRKSIRQQAVILALQGIIKNARD